jgi:hypothetical protein
MYIPLLSLGDLMHSLVSLDTSKSEAEAFAGTSLSWQDWTQLMLLDHAWDVRITRYSSLQICIQSKLPFTHCSVKLTVYICSRESRGELDKWPCLEWLLWVAGAAACRRATPPALSPRSFLRARRCNTALCVCVCVNVHMHIPRRCRLPLPLPTPDENDSIMMLFLMKWDGLGPGAMVTVLPERRRTLCGVPARGPAHACMIHRIDRAGLDASIHILIAYACERTYVPHVRSPAGCICMPLVVHAGARATEGASRPSRIVWLRLPVASSGVEWYVSTVFY